MRLVLQRVSKASVKVEERIVGEISRGLMVLVGFSREDSSEVIEKASEKILNLRVFPDNDGRFQHSLVDISGGVLLVPNFTLYGDASKGRRPDFSSAMKPLEAKPLFEQFVRHFERQSEVATATGIFGAMMDVSLVNDGPVTIVLDL